MQILARFSNSIYFIHTIWKITQICAGNQNIIIIRFPDFHSKLLRFHEMILFIKEHNAVMNHLQILFPSYAIQYHTGFVARKTYSTRSPILLCTLKHLNQRCFPGCAIASDDCDVPANIKIISEPFIFYPDVITSFHFFSPSQISASSSTGQWSEPKISVWMLAACSF